MIAITTIEGTLAADPVVTHDHEGRSMATAFLDVELTVPGGEPITWNVGVLARNRVDVHILRRVGAGGRVRVQGNIEGACKEEGQLGGARVQIAAMIVTELTPSSDQPRARPSPAPATPRVDS